MVFDKQGNEVEITGFNYNTGEYEAQYGTGVMDTFASYELDFKDTDTDDHC